MKIGQKEPKQFTRWWSNHWNSDARAAALAAYKLGRRHGIAAEKDRWIRGTEQPNRHRGW